MWTGRSHPSPTGKIFRYGRKQGQGKSGYRMDGDDDPSGGRESSGLRCGRGGGGVPGKAGCVLFLVLSGAREGFACLGRVVGGVGVGDGL